MELTINKLTRQFGSKTAVNQLSMSLTPGVYGLLGANGAGKTTLMRMICGVLNPTSGSISLDGHSIQSLDANYLTMLGYLPQDFGYYPDFTAKEFMYYIAALKGIDEKKAKTKIDTLLDMVSLSDVQNKKIRTFSGGMKQRLGIAQAVINDPEILVLDEPTAGLDPKERVRFRNLISDFSTDKVVILSTHIVSDVEYIADTILVMKNGSLMLSGSVGDVINSIRGMVWQYTAPEKAAENIIATYCVANLRHLDGGNVELRIVCDSKPIDGALSVDPTLEDLYLYHFQQ